jgi:LmbE family N-acetylglucosaminyl deacetylase
MNPVTVLSQGSQRLRLLVLGAHPDDIEIGCGGTLLRLATERNLEVLWVVFCSTPQRAEEARASASHFLRGVTASRVVVGNHRDGFLPYQGAAVKDEFEALKPQFQPDVVFTHYREDRHQDHRQISELTWNTWRDHLILEYEIPKYDGDFGSPNFFCALPATIVERKIDLLLKSFPSQSSKPWFSSELFRSVVRLRGMECNAAEHYAEAFYCRKLVL